MHVQLRPSPLAGTNGLQCAVLWDRKYRPNDRARSILRQTMSLAGIPDSTVRHLAAYPLPLQVSPLRNQIEEWRSNTLERLVELGVKYVLLVGKPVGELWRPELKLEQVEGKWGVMEGQWCVQVIKNPIAAVIDPTLQSAWRQDVMGFCEGVTRDYGISELGDVCTDAKCLAGVWVYDPDGLGWCRVHGDEGMKKRENARKLRRRKMNKGNEEGML